MIAHAHEVSATDIKRLKEPFFRNFLGNEWIIAILITINFKEINFYIFNLSFFYFFVV